VSDRERSRRISDSFAPSTSTPVMNTARSIATATLLPNGNVLIAGGFDGNPGVDGSLSSTELYSP
jgi:hypothetical protein